MDVFQPSSTINRIKECHRIHVKTKLQALLHAHAFPEWFSTEKVHLKLIQYNLVNWTILVFFSCRCWGRCCQCRAQPGGEMFSWCCIEGWHADWWSCQAGLWPHRTTSKFRCSVVFVQSSYICNELIIPAHSEWFAWNLPTFTPALVMSAHVLYQQHSFNCGLAD